MSEYEARGCFHSREEPNSQSLAPGVCLDIKTRTREPKWRSWETRVPSGVKRQLQLAWDLGGPCRSPLCYPRRSGLYLWALPGVLAFCRSSKNSSFPGLPLVFLGLRASVCGWPVGTHTSTCRGEVSAGELPQRWLPRSWAVGTHGYPGHGLGLKLT